MKKAISLLLALVLCLSLCACGKSEAVKNVEAMIDALGEITLESINAICSAEDAYNALTEDEQKKVKNYETLTKARDSYYEFALVGEWCDTYINLYDVEEMYDRVFMILYEDKSFVSYEGGGEYTSTWHVENSTLMMDNYGQFTIDEVDRKLYLDYDGPSFKAPVHEFYAILDEMFLVVDLAEVDVTEYCEPFLYNFQDVDTWGDPIDEVCKMLMLKNKLYDDGWLYLSQSDDFAIEVLVPEYTVSNEEKITASIEITTSIPFEAVLKLYYWNAEDDEPSCNLNMDDVVLGRTRGKIIYINSAYVKEVKQDEWGRILINDFTESGDFLSGSWYEGFDY